jgi:L-fuculose-phosphate aldolase
MIESIIKEIIFTGKVLYEQRLINTHAGNISIFHNGKIYITKTGSMLGYLKESDIIEVGIEPSSKDRLASRELIVHREIYKKTDAKAIIHAHPTYMVSLSFNLENKFVPIDSEGELFIGEVPIIEVNPPSASVELAQRVSDLMKNYNIVVVKRHGSFIKAQNLDKALQLTSDLEYCANIYTLVKKM